MKRATIFSIFAALVIYCIAGAVQASAQPVDNQQVVLTQARKSYYNLRHQGLSTFQCTMTPDWGLLLQNQGLPPDAVSRAVGILNQLHFVVTVAADDSVTLTHNDLAGQTGRMNAALEQIYGGMEQMTSGFFDTWKLFMLNRPLPEASSEYKLETEGPQQYLLTYKEGTADIATNMGQNFAINNLKVATPQFNSSIQPSFTTSPDGYILSSYTADYSSGNPAEATKLKVTMDYQVVQGLQMLKDLSLSGTYGGNPFGVNLTFSDCQVTKK